ncbi:autotransporter domain-containing protein, partial [Pseudomonas coronafaciens]|uniref:autotransporter outer membrane beta-barrel domain-containing protein n=1 Tax=Pseudomonas coronafaciens TaxID=53409 RepID=UPI000AB05CE5
GRCHSGTGSVTQSGTGTTILTGANTYSGTTTVSAGALQVGNGGTQGSLQGDVVDNAALVLNRSDVLTVGGAISGTGSVTQSGTGTTILTGANTYSGTTTVSAGTLQVGNGGTQGSILGNVLNNAALVFNRSDLTTFGGAITGSGSVKQTGGGTLSLTGVSNYLGGTFLDAGALSIGNASAIGSGTLAMAENTQINFASSFNLTNRITLTGDPYVDVAAGATTELSNVIADGSLPGDLVKLGAGTLVLSGADTYTGATEVSAGVLSVQGSLASKVTVDNGALLMGLGSVGGLNVLAGSTVATGGTVIGTLTVNGNLNVAAGSAYRVNINDVGQGDLLNVHGRALLAGGSVHVASSGTRWSLSHRYVLVTASGGVTGQFTDATADFVFLTPNLSYDASNVYLTLARNDFSFASVGNTQNRRATAVGLESLNHDSDLYQAILPLNASAAQSAFDSLAGASLASTRTAIIEDSRYVGDAIGQHLLEPATSPASGANVWSSTWGHWGGDAGNPNATAQHYNGSGLVLGVDGQLSDLRVGTLVGQHQLDNSAGGGSRASSTATDLGVYADTDLGALHVQGGAAYSWYDTNSHRNIDFAPYAGNANAHYGSGVAQGFIDTGYRFSFGDVALTPFANVARVLMHQDGYHEHHSDTALDVRGSSSTVNYGTLGLRASYRASAGTELHASLGEQHAWGDIMPVNEQRFASGGDNFQVVGVPVARNTAVGKLGVDFAASPALTLNLNAHEQLGNGSTDHDVRLSAEYRF